MSWFGAFRNHYGFAYYGGNRTAVSIDFPLVIIAYLCAVLAVATLISTLGIRGRERWATTLRGSYFVGIGSVILVCLVGHDWLTGSAAVETHYLYRSNNHFRGTVGVRIALHGVNVTLEGQYKDTGGRVMYAESLGWSDYGKEQEMISHYLERGLPHPVLTVMDFLSVDGGGLRWGRNYHSAGYFSCALLWTAFVFWLISNVLLMSVIVYGAFMFLLTGVAMVLVCVVYHVCQPPLPLRIDFGQSVLTTQYGWCFWLCLVSGILTFFLGSLLFMMDHFFHEKVTKFFLLEILDEDDGLDYITPTPPKGTSADKLTPPSSLQFKADTKPRLSGPSRRGSLQPSLPGQRKSSIFLEPQRRSTEFRRGSFVPSQIGSGGVAMGIANKGFEQERSKSNPLFSGGSGGGGGGGGLMMMGGGGPADIQEESGEEVDAVIRIDVGGQEMGSNHRNNHHHNNNNNNNGTNNTDSATMPRTSSSSSSSSSQSPSGRYYDNRKPSLATMREHRENHINERQQLQSSTSTAFSPNAFFPPSPPPPHLSEPTRVIVHRTEPHLLRQRNSAADVTLTMTQEEEDDEERTDVTGGGGRGQGRGRGSYASDGLQDSAFASAATSPLNSEKSSTCEDPEGSRM